MALTKLDSVFELRSSGDEIRSSGDLQLLLGEAGQRSQPQHQSPR
jgi:hypothetical protein